MHKSTSLNQIADNVVSDIKESLYDAAGQLKNKGKEMVQDVKTKGDDLLDEAMGTGEKFLQSSTKWIKKNRAVSIAVAAGVLWFVFGRGQDD